MIRKFGQFYYNVCVVWSEKADSQQKWKEFILGKRCRKRQRLGRWTMWCMGVISLKSSQSWRRASAEHGRLCVSDLQNSIHKTEKPRNSWRLGDPYMLCQDVIDEPGQGPRCRRDWQRPLVTLIRPGDRAWIGSCHQLSAQTTCEDYIYSPLFRQFAFRISLLR